MRALLPDIRGATECHERIEAIQVWDGLTFIELDRMPFDPIGRKEFTKDRGMLDSRMLKNQKLHLRYPEPDPRDMHRHRPPGAAVLADVYY